MARLSSPIEHLKSHYKVVIVGSGYGGGITASRMARAGQEVCIMERGKEFQPGDFDANHQLIKHGEYPDTEAEALREVQMDLPKLHTGPRTGLYDMRVNDDISVFVGCGLGGTSLLNANVALQAVRARISSCLNGRKSLGATRSFSKTVTPSPQNAQADTLS